MSDIALFVIHFLCVVCTLGVCIISLDKAYHDKKKLSETDFLVLLALLFISFIYYMWYDMYFWISNLLD